MRVLLPSHGCYGQRAVELRPVTVGDMQTLHRYNRSEELRRIEIVRRLSDVRIDRVTWNDLCYLYDLCCFSVANGEIRYNVRCSKCGAVNEVKANIGDIEIAEYTGYRKRYVGGMCYNILRASDMLDAVDTSLYSDNEEESLLKSKVAITYGRRHDDFAFVDSLTPSEFGAALAFQEFNHHGFVKVGDVDCRCGETLRYKYDTTSDILCLDPNRVAETFASLSGVMRYEEITSMSLHELNYLIETMNRKYESR